MEMAEVGDLEAAHTMKETAEMDRLVAAVEPHVLLMGRLPVLAELAELMAVMDMGGLKPMEQGLHRFRLFSS